LSIINNDFGYANLLPRFTHAEIILKIGQHLAKYRRNEVARLCFT